MPTTPLNFDGQNRLQIQNSAYDLSGNQKQTGGLTMTWDAEGRMVSSVGGGVTNYVYDGDGRRVMKQGSSGTTMYVYDATGEVVAEYGSASTAACAPCYLTVDQLGSTRVMTAPDGSVIERHDYLPFGEELGAGVGLRTTALKYTDSGYLTNRFTGKERDVELAGSGMPSGLDFFGERYFSSAQGRFTSPDKPFADQHIEDPQSWNLYSYARNNPLKFVDDVGAAVIYADERLRIISDARRQESTSYNTWLQGFEGNGAPDLTIRYGPTANDPDGSPTNGVMRSSIAPPVQNCSSATDCVVTSPAVLKSGTITVNDKLANDEDQTSETLAHEVSHANDARTNPERYRNERTTDANGKVIPHDSRPVEQRAIAGANLSQQERKQFKKEHPQEYKQIEKQRQEQLKQERERRKHEGGN